MLTLRPFEKRDEAAAVAILRHERVKPTYMLPDMTEQEARTMFDHLCKLSHRDDRFVRGVYLDDTLIGWINDTQLADTEIELGWVIAPEHWNCGYATRAVGMALELLREAGFGLVYAGAFAENIASIRVMQKAGMHLLDKTEQLEYRGQTHHCVYYGIYL